MPTVLQLRRGTTAQHSSFTGAEGEVTVNTTKDTLVVHDGSTQGGFELALADLSNTTATTYTDFSVTDSGGDGSLTYNNSTGVFTYTGPSAAEVRAHITAGTGVSISSGAVSIGQAVGTGDSVTFAGVTAPLTGNVTGNVTGNLDGIVGGTTPAAGTFTTLSTSGALTVGGNLTVNGTTTTINSTTLTVDDKEIVLASGAADSAAADGAGITVDGASASILYDHTGTQWEINKPLEVTGSILPAANITYDLGSSGLRWRDLYLSGTTLDLGGSTISVSGGAFQMSSVNVTSTFTLDSVGLTAVQTSAESFADNDTSVMTSAAANDRFRIDVYDSSGSLLN
jgi:hypothetical protein